jgi:hypothetical protein
VTATGGPLFFGTVRRTSADRTSADVSIVGVLIHFTGCQRIRPSALQPRWELRAASIGVASCPRVGACVCGCECVVQALVGQGFLASDGKHNVPGRT